ncbi:hypothetical protein [Streptomyces murinus]|uniref:Uncharacterized protein n=1 Tax=Streptomyces murinus TaxID=33900 RepID=A0A7W3NT97_STRMR|nr:hypothetical protein [Streptomyces murinus]MBA9056314.1 hypothetical protein [Streptomyces murinus]UWW90801.1 hypothetical protein GO605_07940 [Streptomyces murinus]
MLDLRLTRAARPAVQLRRLLVAAASAGTGFLLLSCLGYALKRPEAAGSGALRLAWCVVPVAATVYLALAVARTDPGTRPRPGLSAIGLGPARLMAVSALVTALSTALGSLVALSLFLHLRGDLTGLPFDGAAASFLAAGKSLPLAATLTLLAVVPVVATVAVALALRPRDPRPVVRPQRRYLPFVRQAGGPATGGPATGGPATGGRTAEVEAAGEGVITSAGEGAPAARGAVIDPRFTPPSPADKADDDKGPGDTPSGLPWAVALLAAGLTAQAYAGRTPPTPAFTFTTVPTGAGLFLLGWLLTAVGLVLAAPGLTHLCGRLLQCARPGALRLLAGRGLMAEATRIGRPLGILCAVTAAGYAVTTLYDAPGRPFGPLSALGALVVAGCAFATLLTVAVETRQGRAETTDALLRLGAPATVLRGAAALRAFALLAFFTPLTLAIAALAAFPLTR